MFSKLLKKLLGFGRSEGGNVIIIFAFASVVLITAIGAAIDMSRTNIVRQNQQNAMDLAKRAANNYCTNASNTAARAGTTAMQNCMSAQINKYFYANAKTKIAGSSLDASGNPINVSISDGAVQASSSATVTSDLVKSSPPPASSDNTSAKSPITTTLVTGADNVAWNGVCDTNATDIKNGTRCLVGTSDYVAGNPTWNCNGINGGAKVSCPTVGSCQPSPTAANKCASGNAINSSTTGSTTTWICTGSSSSLNSGTCSYTASVNGACGPTAGSCLSGANPIAGVNPNYTPNYSSASATQTWSCNGSGGGTDATNCSVTICAQSTKTLSCGTGFSGADVISTSDCSTGVAIWSPTSNPNCVSQTACKRYTTTTTGPCPIGTSLLANTTGGTKTVTNYTCPSIYGAAVAGTPEVTVSDNCQPLNPPPLPCPPGPNNEAQYQSNGVCTDCPIAANAATDAPSGDTNSADLAQQAFDSSLTINYVVQAYNGAANIMNLGIQGIPSMPSLATQGPNSNYNGNGSFTSSGLTTTAGQGIYLSFVGSSTNNTTDSYTESYTIDKTYNCTQNPYQQFNDGSYYNGTSYYVGAACVNNDTASASGSGGSASGNQNADSYGTDGCPGDGDFMYESADSIITAYKSVKLSMPGIDNNAPNEVAQCPDEGFTLMETDVISPLKVNINGGDAKLNSDRSIQFSITNPDGTTSIITTYGSLNPDEAWLMIDKDGDGLIKNGIVNGDDFFTDHAGEKENAYHDLGVAFGSFLKQDAQGRSYIPLHKVSDAEKAAEIADAKTRTDKRIGAVKAIDPSLHLKLLDANNNELYASDYFDRIYTDYAQVSKSDKAHHNFVLQVSMVHSIADKKYHFSADQWFVPKK